MENKSVGWDDFLTSLFQIIIGVEMTNEPDYKIQELFDFDKMQPYYKVLKLIPTGEYVLVQRYDEFMAAKVCVRMCRKYKNPIFHYVED